MDREGWEMWTDCLICKFFFLMFSGIFSMAGDPFEEEEGTKQKGRW